MIVFLTLLYVGVLALLVKFEVIKLTLWWKISPLAWMVFLLIVLFIPMQWGAPSGPVTVFQSVVEIVPNVSGEVIEVSAEGSKPLDKGDVLFRIDPEPFQAEVNRLKAALVEAEKAAEMLPADLASANATVAQAEAQLVEAKQKEQSLRLDLESTAAGVVKARSDQVLAAANLQRDEQAAARSPGAVTDQELDVRRAELKSAEAALTVAQSDQQQAQLRFDSQVNGVNTAVAKAEEERQIALAAKQKADLALASVIDGENTTVSQLRSQLARAEYDLDKTTVVAPSDGYVVGLTLRPGQRVANFPARTWMAFVDTEQTGLVVGINQNTLRHVRPGQKAEVVLKIYPGKTFNATVEKIAYITPEGQIQPTGNVAIAPTRDQTALPYGVMLNLDDPDIQVSELPGGGVGTAAVYTDSAQPTHLIRRVMMRMESYMNYILPW